MFQLKKWKIAENTCPLGISTTWFIPPKIWFSRQLLKIICLSCFFTRFCKRLLGQMGGLRWDRRLESCREWEISNDHRFWRQPKLKWKKMKVWWGRSRVVWIFSKSWQFEVKIKILKKFLNWMSHTCDKKFIIHLKTFLQRWSSALIQHFPVFIWNRAKVISNILLRWSV